MNEVQKLQSRLPELWTLINSGAPREHTSVVVPSLSFDLDEIAKISGASFYEERLLFILMRLRHPLARVIYITSHPIHEDIIDYYLQLLAGVTPGHAKRRLMLVSLFDGSPVPLTRKILERPRVIRRLRALIGDPKQAYLTCFNSTKLEEELSLQLRVPLNAASSDLLWLGSKSGCRELFLHAGIDRPAGFENIRSEAELARALVELRKEHPKVGKAVLKLNESFAGQGNAVLSYPRSVPSEDGILDLLRDEASEHVTWGADGETYSSYIEKVRRMGCVVEEFLEGDQVRSPSVQMRINPVGDVEVISSHDQVLGGPVGQEYVGCRFPASDDYRGRIIEAARRVGEALREQGVVSRFGVDFLAVRNGGEDWRLYAVEINLRMGGTTHPFLALEFLTGGRTEPSTGVFLSGRNIPKYYFSTDNLKSPAYRGFLPEDLLELLAFHGLGFQHVTEKGVLFHMIGAISQFGKVGVTCVGDSRDEADQLYEWTRAMLDREAGAGPEGGGHLAPLFERRLPTME